MTVIIGLFIVLSTVFGGYIISVGSIAVIAEAIPHELLVIGGGSHRQLSYSQPKRGSQTSFPSNNGSVPRP